MKLFQIVSFITVALIVSASSCENTPTDPVDPGAAESMANMRPDSAEGFLFIDLDQDRVIPFENIEENNWDICLTYLKCCGQTRTVDVILNSNNDGTGTTRGLVVNSRWEALTSVPTTPLRDEGTEPATRIVNPNVLGENLMFIYDPMADHTIKVSPDKVLVLQSGATGDIFKVQFTSIYKDAEANPTQNTPLGYYHFRYQRAINGAW